MVNKRFIKCKSFFIVIPITPKKEIFHLSSAQPSILRETNNHTAEKADGWRKLAHDVILAYGHKYQRAADYLTQLATNELWRDAELPQLTWHERVLLAPPEAQPRYIMHDAIVNALAPSVPLRTVWQGNRRQ